MIHEKLHKITLVFLISMQLLVFWAAYMVTLDKTI